MQWKSQVVRILLFCGLVPSVALAGDIQTDGALVSTAPEGEPPLAVSSSTTVENLNADLLDGLEAAELALQDHTHPEFDPPAIAFVAVDCGAGESIGEAWKVPAEELVIEISGLCEELVLIRRPEVTLRGTDPTLDGIRPPAGATGYLALVHVLYASPVRFENLSISGSSLHGIETFASDLAVIDCLIEDHASMGIRSSSGAYVEVRRSVISGNGSMGARARSGGTLWIEQSQLIDNPEIGLHGILDSYVVAIDVSVTGSDFPLSIRQSTADLIQVTTTGAVDGAVLVGSNVGISGSTLVGSTTALRMFDQGTTHLSGSTLDGSIVARGQSQVYLIDTTQTAVTAPTVLTGKLIQEGSLVQLMGTTSLLGPNFLGVVGNLTALSPGPVIDGDLFCSSAADAFCFSAENLTGTSDCASCPPPAGASPSSFLMEAPSPPPLPRGVRRHPR